MNYEIVELEEKMVAGLKIRTSNSDPDMGKSINDLWQGFYVNGVYQSILNKQNDKSIGLYTNYESDVTGAYDAMVGCEIQNLSEFPKDVLIQTIPAGKYAKFIVIGDMHTAAGEFWAKLWAMNLDRKYSCDYEEYQSGCDTEHVEIHMYISVN